MSYEQQIEQKKAKLMGRLPALREAALGQRKALRLDKKTTVSGEIVDVEFGRWDIQPTAIQMVFKVTLECGSAKVRREFFCLTLPA